MPREGVGEGETVNQKVIFELPRSPEIAKKWQFKPPRRMKELFLDKLAASH
jgi:hypothetical protein